MSAFGTTAKLIARKEGGIGWVIFNHPERRNAMTAEMGKDPQDRDLELCQSMVEACFASRDFVEGRTAFMQKRKPAFEGR